MHAPLWMLFGRVSYLSYFISRLRMIRIVQMGIGVKPDEQVDADKRNQNAHHQFAARSKTVMQILNYNETSRFALSYSFFCT